MNLLAYLDARARRRHERWIAGGARSAWDRLPGWPSAQMIVALLIIALFSAAFFREGDKDTRNLMVGAIVAAFAGAWGYFLGSSNGAARANDRNDKLADLSHEMARKVPSAPPPPASPSPKPLAEMTDDELSSLAIDTLIETAKREGIALPDPTTEEALRKLLIAERALRLNA